MRRRAEPAGARASAHPLAFLALPLHVCMHDTMVGMKRTSTTISLVKEATAVPQQRLASEGRLSSEAHALHVRRHIARNFCASTTTATWHHPHPPEAPMRPPRGAALLLHRSPCRHPPTQKHSAPLQPHHPGWGDKDGDRTSGDVISHRPGADPEVEAAGEEPAWRQRRGVAWQRGCPARGQGCRRGPLTCASPYSMFPIPWPRRSLGRLPGSAATCERGTTPFGDTVTIT